MIGRRLLLRERREWSRRQARQCSPSNVDCHVTLPQGSCPSNRGITLLFRGAPSMTAWGQKHVLPHRNNNSRFIQNSRH
jgi:hypothetical protein